MKVKPLADRVLVKTEKTESKTAGGIIIPDTAQEKTQIAVVIAVGTDKEKITVQPKQRVMYDKYAGLLFDMTIISMLHEVRKDA